MNFLKNYPIGSQWIPDIEPAGQDGIMQNEIMQETISYGKTLIGKKKHLKA